MHDKRRLFVPLGAKAKVTVDKLRAGVVKAVNHVRNTKIGGTWQFTVPNNLEATLSDTVIAETIAQSAMLTNYSFDKYVAKPAYKDIDEIVIAGAAQIFESKLLETKLMCGL